MFKRKILLQYDEGNAEVDVVVAGERKLKMPTRG